MSSFSASAGAAADIDRYLGAFFFFFFASVAAACAAFFAALRMFLSSPLASVAVCVSLWLLASALSTRAHSLTSLRERRMIGSAHRL